MDAAVRIRRPSVALLAAVATLAVALPACESDEPTSRPAQLGGSETKAEPACVPRGGGHARICALAPPQRRAETGSAYKVTTISGASFWVILPKELAPSTGVVAVPEVPLRVGAELTTAPPRDAADRYCDDFPECEPIVVRRESLPEPLIRWDDASGTIRDLGVTTLDLGAWTLVLSGEDADRAERVARAISSSVGADGYPRLASTDPRVPLDSDWAGVLLWVSNPASEGEHHLIQVIPGCELTTKQPDLGGSDARPELDLHEPDTVTGGRWCVGGRYWVDVTFAEGSRLELLHQKLRIVPAGDQGNRRFSDHAI
jgi:hypothetical protein